MMRLFILSYDPGHAYLLREASAAILRTAFEAFQPSLSRSKAKALHEK
jgi:hypothetical protein